MTGNVVFGSIIPAHKEKQQLGPGTVITGHKLPFPKDQRRATVQKVSHHIRLPDGKQFAMAASCRR